MIFEFFRIIFFLFYFGRTNLIPFSEVLNSFPSAFLLDNSTVAYMLIVPFFLLFLFSIFPRKIFLDINKAYFYLIIAIAIIVEVSNISIYGEWGIKLNYKALSYLSDLSEAISSARSWVLIGGGLMISVFSLLWIYLSQRLKLFVFSPVEFSWKFSLIWAIIVPVLIFGGMRGSVNQIPISQSQSYHSKSDFVNQASVNTLWNLGHSIYENSRYVNDNPFKYYSKEEANIIVDSLYGFKRNDTQKLFKNETPNIVLVFLESWSGSFIDELGGDLHITKGFTELCKEGYLFTNHYASGTLSHQGISAILSGTPSTPFSNIIKQPSKYHGMQCLAKDLKTKGYESSFLFGGQLNYGNIKAYIYYNEFDHIEEGEDFAERIPRGKLGVHDQYLFDKLLNNIATYQQPFFAAAFTLSSHSPFDMPVQDFTKKGGSFRKLFNSIYYSDSCLIDFVKKAQKKDWYKNTIFVFVADHAHPSPYKYPYFSSEARKIPLLFYGEPLKNELRGKVNDVLISQTDFPATILAQLNLPYSQYRWSKNVMNPNISQFAYFGFDNGYGWIEPNKLYCYLKSEERIVDWKFDNQADSISLARKSKAFIQVLYQEYLDF